MKRIAIKIGSNVLSRADGKLDITQMSALVEQIAGLYHKGYEIILVSSGAVAAGRGEIGADASLDEVSSRQLYSAIETDFYGLSKKPERVFWAGKMIAMLFGTVLDNDAVSPERKQHRLDALRYAGYLAQVIQQHHIMDVDFSEQIPLHVLAGIVQSIYYVSEHQEKYMISPYRSSKKRSLMATLKSKHKEMDTIEAYTWENIISFRIMTIIGKQEIADLCNSIQLLTFQVFEKIASGNSFAQILKKHNFFVSEVRRLEDQVWTDPYLPVE